MSKPYNPRWWRITALWLVTIFVALGHGLPSAAQAAPAVKPQIAVAQESVAPEAATPVATESSPQSSPQAIPLDQMGAAADKQNGGEGSSLLATPEGAQITLHWETLDESGLDGFHIWRGNSPAAAEIRLTDALIGALGGLNGHAYRWQDGAILAWGERHYYWLEVVEVDGRTTFTGPVDVQGIGKLFLPSVGR